MPLETRQGSVTLDVKVTIPRQYFEVWMGIKALHGLDDSFLNYMANLAIKQALITLMRESDFGE